MGPFKEVYVLTEQIFQMVSKAINKDQRDEHIETITSLLNQREQLLLHVQAPFSEEEKQQFQEMLSWNKVITEKFALLKQNIQQDMVNLKKSKATNQQYVNPYQDVSTSDGMFYDKRK